MDIKSVNLRQIEESHVSDGFLKIHRDEVNEALKMVGANRYDLLLPETHTLPLLVEAREEIKGVIYGHYRQDSHEQELKGRGMLVATYRRIMLLDHKPLFLKYLEYPYRTISAISFTKAGALINVTVHTRVGDLSITTGNKVAAQRFINAVQSKICVDN